LEDSSFARAPPTFSAASSADAIPVCPGTAPWRQIKIDVSICLFILPPIYLSIYLSICIYLHLSVDPRGYPFIYPRSVVHLRIFTGFDASFRRETERDASYAAQKFHFQNFSSRRSRRTIYRRWECLAIIRPAALSERAPIPQQNFPNYRTVFDSPGDFSAKFSANRPTSSD